MLAALINDTGAQISQSVIRRYKWFWVKASLQGEVLRSTCWCQFLCQWPVDNYALSFFPGPESQNPLQTILWSRMNLALKLWPPATLRAQPKKQDVGKKINVTWIIRPIPTRGALLSFTAMRLQSPCFVHLWKYNINSSLLSRRVTLFGDACVSQLLGYDWKIWVWRRKHSPPFPWTVLICLLVHESPCWMPVQISAARLLWAACCRSSIFI